MRQLRFTSFKTGDDALEKLFGKLRMLGGHNSAMSYQQAIERLGHACDLQALYLQNPDLEQAPRRLNMTRSEHVDHLNMASWTGEVTASSCHASSCHAPAAWAEGGERAKEPFTAQHMDPTIFDYNTIFAVPGVDMSRPFGEGKYPGVNDGDETDDSLIPDPVPTGATSSEAESSSSEQATQVVDELDDEEAQEDGLTFTEGLEVFGEAEIVHDPSRPGFDPNAHVDIGNGKLVHRQRVCRLLFNRFFDPKSFDRLKRVCGFSKSNGSRRDLEAGGIVGPDLFVIGDLFLTLLRTNTTVSLAVVCCTAIHDGNKSLGSILSTTVRDPKSKIRLSGQVLTMQMVPTLHDENESLPTPLPPTSADVRAPDWKTQEDSSYSWIWTGGYLTVDPPITGTSQSTEKVAVVTVPGVLTELVNPAMVNATPRLGSDIALKINSEGRTWQIDDGTLGAACEMLWATFNTLKLSAKDFAVVKKRSMFPYTFSDGTEALLCRPATEQLQKRVEDVENRKCHLCGIKAGKKWRGHMGEHILRFLRRVTETLLQPIEEGVICGFCARSDAPECAVALLRTQTSYRVLTNCGYCMEFNYKTANDGSETTVCRNVPVVCLLCYPDGHKRNSVLPAHWRYNMPLHLSSHHPDYASPLNRLGANPLPHAVWESMKLGDDEEKRMGIPKGNVPALFTSVAPAVQALDRTDTLGKRKQAPTAASGAAARRKTVSNPKK
ncbi:hypothetical protein MKEN_01449900 [Mycena kentingensis (nom. inval.)]|nr:hypothetical protein MKEN_01449900 [Mycena kentingensis (nom. inval.)]